MTNFMDPESLKAFFGIINESGCQEVNVHIHLYPESDVITVEPIEPKDEKPNTLLVEITAEKDRFKNYTRCNTKGFPIMENVRVGWKANLGERFEVYVDPIQGDSGALYWELWQGPSHLTDIEQLPVRNHYITKSKTRKV